MGKKKDEQLGKALQKAKRSKRRARRAHQSEMHTTDMEDSTEAERARRLQSATERNDLAEFMETALMSGRKVAGTFRGEAGLSIVTEEHHVTQMHAKRMAEQLKNAHRLRVPRRPEWHSSTTREELIAREKESFLNWRRQLAALESNDALILTPFEKNLEVWRQLWRVTERSHVVVQIVDARDPLLYRCVDLEALVAELGPAPGEKEGASIMPPRKMLLLVNKADLLPSSFRRAWADYFERTGIDFVFFSAAREKENMEAGEQEEPKEKEEEEEKNKDLVLNKMELLQWFQSMRPRELKTGPLMVGMIGYPNVGKSSTVNVLCGSKRAAVSSTPGKTRHFQTLHVTEDLVLCDCPGLVFPTFTTSKASLVCSGILPIDQMRAHGPPCDLVAQRIPREILNGVYGIQLPPPEEGRPKNAPPTGRELARTVAAARGFMTAHGQPDEARASRLILKDYVNGKLLFCHQPPVRKQERSEKESGIKVVETIMEKEMNVMMRQAAGMDECGTVEKKEDLEEKVPVHDLDAEFFGETGSVKASSLAHVMGGKDIRGGRGNAPSKKKKHKKGKKKKTRQVYG